MDTRRITGQTKIMLLLADPVSHVVGTEAITAHMRSAGHDFVCVPAQVAAEDLPYMIDALRKLRNCIGSGVTIPHKVRAAGLLDALTPRAQTIGSVNCIRRDADGTLTGDNVDGSGFVRGAADAGVDLAALRVLLLGAGGAGRSLAFALAEGGVKEVAIANRDTEKAAALAAAVMRHHSACTVRVADADATGFDMVINATSLGMAGKNEGDPIDFTTLSQGMIVADIVMVPEMTRLLEAARHMGCRLIYGRQMMQGQLALMREFLGL